MEKEAEELPWWASIYDKIDLIIRPISLKSVCDKIIHADVVGKSAAPNSLIDDAIICMHFEGTHGRKNWVMDLPLGSFMEYVLNFLDKAQPFNT